MKKPPCCESAFPRLHSEWQGALKMSGFRVLSTDPLSDSQLKTVMSNSAWRRTIISVTLTLENSL